MKTLMDSRHEYRNPARYDWLFLYIEPAAGNSPIGLSPGKNPILKPHNMVRRRVLRAKLRNRAWRKLRLANRLVKHRNRRNRAPKRNSVIQANYP